MNVLWNEVLSVTILKPLLLVLFVTKSTLILNFWPIEKIISR